MELGGDTHPSSRVKAAGKYVTEQTTEEKAVCQTIVSLPPARAGDGAYVVPCENR
jgi:hypothetical protein